MECYPRISIITPSYNQRPFLEETIQSVLNQGYPNLEYIVIDGGSTDNSVEIIKKYKDQLAYWVSEPDKGQSDAINKGFRVATGEILAWLNSDDLYLPGTLQTVAEYFSSHPDVDCVYGDIYMIDEHGRRLFLRKSIPFDCRAHLFGGCLVPQPASFFRKTVIDRVGYLDTSLHYNMDTEFFVRCGHEGIKFGHIPQPLACFRLHPASKTQHREEIDRVNRIITIRYAGRICNNERMNDTALRLVRLFYRSKIFLTRALTRGDAVPFREALALYRIRRRSLT